MRLLVIEDDARVGAHVTRGLRDAGHTVDLIADGREGLFHAAAGGYDVIVLDRMLPHVDGMAILSALRTGGDPTPVLLLSALGTVEDRVAGLRAGANDYLTKPFALIELVARVEALGRRPAPASDAMMLEVADLRFDLRSRTVERAGRRIELSPREQRLLEYMLRHQGHVLTRGMILEAVWDYRFDPQTNIVDQHISNLRQKIDRGFTPVLIHTVRGAGYTLRLES